MLQKLKITNLLIVADIQQDMTYFVADIQDAWLQTDVPYLDMIKVFVEYVIKTSFKCFANLEYFIKHFCSYKMIYEK